MQYVILVWKAARDLVLKAMGKMYTPTGRRGNKKRQYSRDDVFLNFVVGYPTESKEDFNKTLQFIDRIKEYVTK